MIKKIHGNVGKIRTQDVKEKMSKSISEYMHSHPGHPFLNYWKGRKMKVQSKLKMSNSHKKRWENKKFRNSQLGENSKNWKGDTLSKGGIHSWMKRTYGSPRKCDECGITNAKRFDWASIDHTYLRNRSKWRRLCRSCHRKYDYRNKNKYVKTRNQ